MSVPASESERARAWAVALVIGVAACDRGHYAVRDRQVDTSGRETTSEASAEGTPDATTEGTGESSSGSATSSGTSGEGSTTAGASAEGSTSEGSTTAVTEAPPREDPPPVRPDSRVTITVRTTSGPVSAAVARVALGTQRPAIDACYRSVLGPDAAGSIRASISIEASGAPRVELETMTPSLDRVIPCVDQALERTRFPASADGRPTHVIAEVSRTP
ncbi:MAG: hypothetical protein K1X94_00745 [Sandaracinaceae bacterium]|nr:hypothetical protein [Sandaracinaceae bacterium]